MGNTVTPLGPISKLISGTTGGVLAYIDAEGNELDFSGASADSVVQCSDVQFGGYWDGAAGHDDGPAIEAAAAYAATFDPPKSIMLPPVVGIASSVYIPAQVHVLGHNYSPGKINTRIIPLTGMSLSTGYVFGMNTTDGSTQAESQTWDARGYWNGIFGVEFDNSVNRVASAKLCIFAYWFKAADIKHRRAMQLIKRMTGTIADGIQISNVTIHPSDDNSLYQIDLSEGSGDSWKIDTVIASTSDSGDGLPLKSIYVNTGNSGEISNCINGTIYLKACVGATINNLHQEFGQLLLENTSGSVRNLSNMVHDADTYYPIDCTTSGSVLATYTITLDNCIFKQGSLGFDGHVPAEVRVTRQHVLRCVNTCRQISAAGETAKTGIRVDDGTSTAISAWNNNAGYLSTNGVLAGYIPSGSDTASLPANDYTGVTGTITKVTGNGSSTFVNSTTYYYIAQFLIDNTAGRLMGRNQTGAEVSVTMSATVANTQRNYIPMGMGTGQSKFGIVRLYRGTSAGYYDKYCDIPIINAREAGDSGDYVAGLPWIARGGPGVDTIIPVLGTFMVTPNDGAVRINPTTQVQASSTTPAIDLGKGNYITFTCGAGNITWGASTNNPRAGEIVTIRIQQDGTGGRTQTWNATFKGAWPTGSGTANQVKVITSRSDGTNLIFQSDSGWY